MPFICPLPRFTEVQTIEMNNLNRRPAVARLGQKSKPSAWYLGVQLQLIQRDRAYIPNVWGYYCYHKYIHSSELTPTATPSPRWLKYIYIYVLYPFYSHVIPIKSQSNLHELLSTPGNTTAPLRATAIILGWKLWKPWPIEWDMMIVMAHLVW